MGGESVSAATGRALGHLSVAERRARGRLAREETPRSLLSALSTEPGRPDPVDLLLGQESSRVRELVPVRHARMAVSPFTFYRGSAVVMAHDLARQPRTSLTAQLCGDAHLSNFGLFGAPDRSVVFDLNDFDETHPGPFEWDVKRLATSFVLAARDSGAAEAHGLAAAAKAAESYRRSIADFAGRSELDIWYHRVEQLPLRSAVEEIRGTGRHKATKGTKATKPTKAEALERRRVEKAMAKARARDAWSAIAKITEVVDGRRRFLHRPPLLVRIEADEAVTDLVEQLYDEYLATLQPDRQELLSRYAVVDIGHKVVGVGSVGLLAFVLLLRGRDEKDLMVLQVKQAQASVLEAVTEPSRYARHGQRVVTGQRLIQAASDSFLGWIDGPSGRSFYVRQLRDMKWSPDPATLVDRGLQRYAELCGHTLAQAHARSGDAVAIAAYLGAGTRFEREIAAFSGAYADQVEEDFGAFVRAVDSERVTAVEEAGGGEVLRAVHSAAVPADGAAPR